MPCCSHLLILSDVCSQKSTIFVPIGAPDGVQGGELSELMAQPPWGVTLVRHPATLVTALQSAMWSATRGKEALIITVLPILTTLKHRPAYITIIYAIKLWCCDGQPSCLPWTGSILRQVTKSDSPSTPTMKQANINHGCLFHTVTVHSGF
jgi:hypothetical protein